MKNPSGTGLVMVHCPAHTQEHAHAQAHTHSAHTQTNTRTCTANLYIYIYIFNYTNGNYHWTTLTEVPFLRLRMFIQCSNIHFDVNTSNRDRRNMKNSCTLRCKYRLTSNQYSRLLFSEDRLWANLQNNRRTWRHNANTSRSSDVTEWTVVTSQYEVWKDHPFGENGGLSNEWFFGGFVYWIRA